MEVQNRLIKYCKFNTQSDPNSETVPTTASQMEFSKILKEEMIAIGLQDVVLDDLGYLYGTLPSTVDYEVDTIGFIAHVDTAPDFTAENVNPRIIENYDGSDIQLNENIIMKITDFPKLEKLKGNDIIVTDGNTLLGADDKAGIAEILTACEYLIQHPEIKHGKIRVGFTPDEEVGRGAHHFDIEGFGCKFAYTMDGGEVNFVADETFNAASIDVDIKGFSIHPGEAKGKMINALNIGIEFHNLFPKSSRPETTEGREGFTHLTDMNGDVEEAHLHYILRNHDARKLELQKEAMGLAKDYINKLYHQELVSIKIHDEYRNMHEILKNNPEPVNYAKQALTEMGLDVEMESVRGGTDGATLTFNGLPCPNLGTGGGNYHGRYEYCCIQEMEQVVSLIIKIAELVAGKE